MHAPLPGIARDAHGKPQIGTDAASLYAFGDLVRRTETLILDLFARGLLSGTTHTCLGQELCSIAIVRALSEPDDVVLSNHRNHGHFLAYSGDVTGLLAEVMGRQAGVCGGYGGSQHIAYRHFHSNGVQAGMTGIGVGLALAAQRRGSRAIVATLIGDGTLGEGLLYESMNLAAIWQLPVLFVVENNAIAQTSEPRHTLGGSVLARGAAFGLRTWALDDSDPEFADRAQAVVNAMRSANQPGMLEITTRRLGPHSKGDDLRSDQEKNCIAERDPLAALGRRLTPTQREAIEQANQQHVASAEQVALASPEADFDQAPDSCLHPVEAGLGFSLPQTSGNVRSALNTALRALLDQHPEVVLLGEDLHDPYGGAFKVTAGLSTDFPGRVISTPISEAGITGTSVGLALAGMRPILEIMFADFLSLCLDQLYNHAVKFPGMFANTRVPMIIRTPCGGRRGYGPTHSQSPENIFVSVPGLTVLYPSHRHAVGQILVDTVTRWPNPTLFLEHKLLYGENQDAGDYLSVPADPADAGAALFPTLRRGALEPDVTLVAFGGMLPVVEKAVAILERDEELAVEVISPALLAPLPRQTLIGALIGRPLVIIVEESHHEFGVSAELLASLAEAGFTGRVARIGTPAVPLAAARSLERRQLVDEAAIIDAVLDHL